MIIAILNLFRMAILSFSLSMRYFRSLILLACICLTVPLSAQVNIKISVFDQHSSLPIEGVSISSDDLKSHAVSNPKGIIQLESVVKDSARFLLRHVSYNDKIVWIKENETHCTFELVPLQVKLKNVNISAYQRKRNSPSLSSVVLSRKDIEQLPSYFGETDIIKILEIQPGVIRTNELNPALNVRGGSGGHNSFVLDGQPIFNPNHLLGILSTFNADLLESANLVKDGYHPKLGGSLSSFIHVKNRIGNKQKLTGKMGIGLLSSRLSLEGPVVDNKVSFLFGIRRSYFDLFAKSYNKINDGKKDFSPLPEYNFQDLQLKLHSKINQRWFAEVEMFRSLDKLDLLKEGNDKRLITNWSNQFVGFHVKHYSNSSFNAHFISGLGTYKFDLNRDHNNLLRVDSKTNVWNNKLEFVQKTSEKLETSGGVFFDLFNFQYKNKLSDTDVVLKENNSNKNAAYCGAYVNFKYEFLKKLIFNFGGRLNYYKQDTWINEFSPRLSCTYKMKEDLTLNLNYGVTHQFNHLLSTYGMNLPNDIWYPSNSKIPSEQAHQLALSIEKVWANRFVFRVSSFVKDMKNVIDYSDGTDLLFKKVEDEVLFGVGKSKGIELEIDWNLKKLHTSLFYTLSDTWRKFKEINNGSKFNPPYDIKHTINFLSRFQISDKLSCSASWCYASGQSVSFPIGAIVVQGAGPEIADSEIVPIYGKRYNVRMPSTHRLDISLKYSKTQKKGRSIFSVGVYNVYNRSNPYFIYFDTEKNENGSRRFLPKQKALIPFLPTINYTYEFN
jgi:hypothetical protein